MFDKLILNLVKDLIMKSQLLWVHKFKNSLMPRKKSDQLSLLQPLPVTIFQYFHENKYLHICAGMWTQVHTHTAHTQVSAYYNFTIFLWKQCTYVHTFELEYTHTAHTHACIHTYTNIYLFKLICIYESKSLNKDTLQEW